jgi:hypothetical protein
VKFSVTVLLLLMAANVTAQNIEYVGSIALNNAIDVYVAGNHAYVACGEDGIQIVNISDPANPWLEGSYNTPDYALESVVLDDYAYIADCDSGLYIINVSDSAHPLYTGTYPSTLFGSILGVSASDSNVFINNYYLGGIQSLDISNPANPVLLDYCGTTRYVDEIFISGNYAYVAASTMEHFLISIFVIIDISDPANMLVIGGQTLVGRRVRGIFTIGNYTLISMPGWGLLIYDVSNRNFPSWLATYRMGTWADGIYATSNHVYIANGNEGLQVFYIGDPTSPFLDGLYATPDRAYDVFVYGEYAYVADSSALLVLRYTPSGINDNQSHPTTFFLAPNYPNPFNASTMIEYGLPESGPVQVEIFDILGRKIQTLVDETQSAGYHQLTWKADDVPSGTYFYRIQAGEKSQTKKCVLLK